MQQLKDDIKKLQAMIDQMHLTIAGMLNHVDEILLYNKDKKND